LQGTTIDACIVNFEQAFDGVWHDGMWRVMQMIEQLIRLVQEICRSSSVI